MEMNFGEYMKIKRKELGISLREVSKRTGISQPYLSQIESSKRLPSFDKIALLSEALKTDFIEALKHTKHEWSVSRYVNAVKSTVNFEADENDLSVTSKIEKWAIARNLHTADPMKQALKLGEEYGELCQGLVKGRFEDTKDAIGDMIVVLTIMSMQLETTVEDCMEMAYNEIKDRKGKMVNGVFVKESDL